MFQWHLKVLYYYTDFNFKPMLIQISKNNILELKYNLNVIA